MTTKCENPTHEPRDAKWRYRIVTMDAEVITAFACQQCTKYVRRVYGQNIQSVKRI